jgi:YVTN family beta-propeller protein
MPERREGFLGQSGMLLLAALIACSDGSTGPSVTFTHPALTTIVAVTAPGRPYGVAISKQGRTYVSLLDNNTVIQDSALPVDNLLAPIAVGLVPPHVVFNPAGDRAYVTNQSGQSMSVINVATGTAIATVPLGHDGFNLITSRDGGKVFVSVATGQVYVVATGTNAIVDTIHFGPAVNGFARHPTQNLIYISSRDGGNVSEVNAGTNAVVRTFTTGGLPQRLAVSPDGKELLVANEMNGLEIWNLGTGTRDTALAIGAYGLDLSPDGLKAYLTDGPGGHITIVDRLARAVDTVLTIGGITRNVAFDHEGKTAVITNEGDFVTVVH